MSRLEECDFVFLDFDGLLVNTEQLHYRAYQQMCKAHGYYLSWDFPTYCTVAHASSEGIRKKIYEDFPKLMSEETPWTALYAEKKYLYEKMLEEGSVELMPEVEQLLAYLQKKKILSCVVTNSFRGQIEAIKENIPLLFSIPYWVTREEYSSPKPSPDPYLVAKEKYAKDKKRLIGFEDTMRGWESLQAAGIEGVDDFKQYLTEKGAVYYASFGDFFSS
jgi:HAD superfamily hydrolase (TIGR01509 family)